MEQEKIDILAGIISSQIKAPKAKSTALNILTELVDWLSNTMDHNKALMAWKTNNSVNDIECELQKYVHLLVFHGYSQKYIKTIRPECTLFAAKNVQHIPKHVKLDDISISLIAFEIEKDRAPENYQELKDYINEIKG